MTMLQPPLNPPAHAPLTTAAPAGPATTPSAPPQGFRPSPAQSAVVQHVLRNTDRQLAEDMEADVARQPLPAEQLAQARAATEPTLAEKVAQAEAAIENRAALRLANDLNAVKLVEQACAKPAVDASIAEEQADQVRRTEGATAARVPQEWKPSLRLNRGRSWHPEDANREARMREAEWWRERLLEVLNRPDRPDPAEYSWTRTTMMNQTLRDIEHVLWQFGWRDGAAAARVRPSVPPVKFRTQDGFLASGDEFDPECIDPQDAGDMLRMAYRVCVGLDRHVTEGRLTDGLILGWLYELQTELADHGDALGERGLKRPEWSPL